MRPQDTQRITQVELAIGDLRSGLVGFSEYINDGARRLPLRIRRFALTSNEDISAFRILRCSINFGGYAWPSELRHTASSQN
jgi:hypothetical protein